MTLRHEKADMLPVDFMYEDYRTMQRFADHYGMTQEELLEYTGCDIVYCNVMDEIQKFVYDPHLMEFCLKNRFPNLSTFRLFKPFGVEKYGVYIDAGFVELKNPKRAILIGRTTAVIDCDTLERHEIYVFQGASATVNARKWSVVSIKGVTGARVIKNVSENAIIL